MKEEDTADLLRKYNKKDPEQDKRARAELERTNAESEFFALEVIGKKQRLDYRKQWNFHIKWAFWLYNSLMIGVTVVSLFRHWYFTVNLIVGFTTITQAIVLVLVNFIFPRSQIQ